MKCNEGIISVLIGVCLFVATSILSSKADPAVRHLRDFAVENLNSSIEQIVRVNAPTNRSTDVCAVVYRVADGNRIAAVSIGELKSDTAFEPGSIIKPLTLVAALEEGVAKIDTLYSTKRDDPRYSRLPGDGNHTWPEMMTAGDGVVRSSNIVLAKLGVDVGVTNLLKTFQRFGIGRQEGMFPPSDSLDSAKQSCLGTGQFLLTTPDEIARAYVILANRGRSPWTGERVVSAPTADAVTKILCRAVSMEGTARRAAIKNVAVAGKTGTANRCVNGSYGSQYNASFVGFFPAEKPLYVIAIVYRTDKNGDCFYQGGHRAAVAFRQIATMLINDGSSDVENSLRKGDAEMTERNELNASLRYHDAAQKGSDLGRIKELVAEHALSDAVAELSPAVIDNEICRAACTTKFSGRLGEVNRRLLERYAATPRFSISDVTNLSSNENHRFACELASIGNMNGIAYLFTRKLININDAANGSALHHAMAAGDVAMVKWLVGLCYADPNCRDENGKTPKDWAEEEMTRTDETRRHAIREAQLEAQKLWDAVQEHLREVENDKL